MPDDFDSLANDPGTDPGDLSEPSTVADEGAQDLLGSDAEQSEDFDGTPAQNEEDSDVPGNFDAVFDEAAENLLRYQPEQGIEHIKGKLASFLQKQNKSYTQRMTKISKEYKPVQQKAQQLDTIVRALQTISQTDPEWVKGASARIQAAAEGKYHEWGKEMGNSSSDTPLRSKEDLVNLIRSTIKGEMGSFQAQSSMNTATSQVDRVLARTKNERLHGHRDDLIRALSEHPNWTVSQALGSVDPDLLVQLKQPPKPPSPVQRSLSDFNMRGPKKFTNPDDAFFDALAKHGDPDLVREP